MYVFLLAAVVLLSYVMILSSTSAADRRGSIVSSAIAPSYFYAIVSGIIGSVSLLLGKVVSKLVLSGESQFLLSPPITLAFMVGTVSCLALQLHWFDKALELGGELNTIAPIFHTFWIGFGVISASVFYPDQQSGPIFLAFCSMLIGLYYYYISSRHDVGRRRVVSVSTR